MYMMSKIAVIAMCVITGMTILSCESGKKETGTENLKDSDSVATEIEEAVNVPVEIMGRVGDGTSMNAMELITHMGDTLRINMNCSAFEAGDKAYVIYSRDRKGYLVSSVSINLTTLEHVWSQKDLNGMTKSLEIDPNGIATTYDMSIEYDKWKILNGKLLLHSPAKIGTEEMAQTDTFDIMELTDDRLILANGNFETIFEREN